MTVFFFNADLRNRQVIVTPSKVQDTDLVPDGRFNLTMNNTFQKGGFLVAADMDGARTRACEITGCEIRDRFFMEDVFAVRALPKNETPRDEHGRVRARA